MRDLPEAIPFDKVQAFLYDIGIDADACIHVHLNSEHVEVKQIRTNSDGKYLGAGKDIATITTTIDYDREPRDETPAVTTQRHS